MIDYINYLIDSYNFPILTAFLLGVLASLSPCPLATNLTAIAYISREINTTKNTLFNGLAYTLGRGVSYTALSDSNLFRLLRLQDSELFPRLGGQDTGTYPDTHRIGNVWSV